MPDRNGNKTQMEIETEDLLPNYVVKQKVDAALTRLTILQESVDALIQRGQGRIFTFSIVCGTRACDARCPFCVSKQTGFENLPKQTKINRQRLRKAARLAQIRQATTVLLTGKGEPTLYPDEITEYLEELEPFNFPLIELQTNGLQMGEMHPGSKGGPLKLEHLLRWKELGLNTIALSVVDIDRINNGKVYRDPYPPLASTIRFLHDTGFSVRLCVMMQNGMVDSPNGVLRVVNFCKEHRVEQLTIRPIKRPDNVVEGGSEYERYIVTNGLSDKQVEDIRAWVKEWGTHILTIAHGAHASFVYDVGGQNLCVSDCLTVDATTDDIRTLIYYGTGRITFDWQYKGAVIM
jgi:pyruvate-formate lyase-activating enzyme